MGRIWTRPRTPSAAALLSRHTKPAGLFIPADRHLVSALLFPQHHHERDVTGRKWTINGTPAYAHLGGVTTLGYGQGLCLLSSTTNYLSTADPVLRDLPLSDAFSVCIIQMQPNSGWSSPTVLAWNGTDDIIFVPASSDASGGMKLFWRDMGGTTIFSTVNVVYKFNVWHITFKKVGSDIEALSYVDGFAHTPVTLNTESNRGPFSNVDVGCWNAGGQYSSGGLKSVFFWDKALTGNEVRRHADSLYGFNTKPANDSPFRYPEAVPPATGEDNAIFMGSNF